MFWVEDSNNRVRWVNCLDPNGSKCHEASSLVFVFQPVDMALSRCMCLKFILVVEN